MDQRMYDEEDLALSTLHEFLHRQSKGQFTRLSSRQDLWRLLVSISLNKSRNQRRFLRRLCRSSDVASVWRIDGREGVITNFVPPVRSSDVVSSNGRVVRRSRLGRHAPSSVEVDSPEWIVTMADQCSYLMSLLDRHDGTGKLRQIATLRLEGWSVVRMSEFLGCTRRTVGVRLELIQAIWRNHLEQQV